MASLWCRGRLRKRKRGRECSGGAADLVEEAGDVGQAVGQQEKHGEDRRDQVEVADKEQPAPPGTQTQDAGLGVLYEPVA